MIYFDAKQVKIFSSEISDIIIKYDEMVSCLEEQIASLSKYCNYDDYELNFAKKEVRELIEELDRLKRIKKAVDFSLFRFILTKQNVISYCEKPYYSIEKNSILKKIYLSPIKSCMDNVQFSKEKQA